MEYRTIELADRELFDRKYKEEQKRCCEHSFSNNFLWQVVYPAEFAVVEGCLNVRFTNPRGLVYDFPVGNGDKKAAMDQILAEGKANGGLEMYGILKEEVELLEQWYPGIFEIEPDRDLFDYLYESEHLIQLRGKKLHGKRNHIARFKDHDNWNYEPLMPENREDCLQMNRIWKDRHAEKWNGDMEREFQVVNTALRLFDQIGLVGGVLRLDGEVVAFTLGEPLCEDTFVVHFEKAFPEIQGAYPMINQQFVEHECQNYRYVNREEDAGEEGLRKAKLSYQPDILLEKYSVKLK